MVNRIIYLLILLPIAIALVMLSVANRSPVELSLDPFNPAEPAISFTVPLFALIFGGVIAGLILGSIGTWFSQGKHRRLARQKREEATRWHFEADKQKERAEKMAEQSGVAVGGSPILFSGN